MRKKQRKEKRNEGITQTINKIIELVLKPILLGFSIYCISNVLLFGNMNQLFVVMITGSYLLLIFSKYGSSDFALQTKSDRYNVMISK